MALMIGLCTGISSFCAVMLLRGFSKNKVNKLFWLAMCFVAFAVENALLFIDLVLLPNFDLSLVRYLVALIGMFCLGFSFFEKAAEE